MNKNIFLALSLALLTAVLGSCRKNEYGTVDLTMPETDTVTFETVDATYRFSHPCAMYSEDDFDRVKKSLDDGTAPDEVKEAYEALRTNSYTQLSYTAQPQELIIRGDPTGYGESENYSYAMRDASAAYQMALMWKLSGNDDYAKKATSILDAWANKCTAVVSNDANRVLAAGAQGYTFANAAEILRSYSEWSAGKQTVFKNWMLNVFASVNKDFLDKHTGSNVCSDHYWSNWDLVNLASYLTIGILTESSDMVNYVVNYFYTGVGNGCLYKLIQGTHTDPLGTGEEICQDQESGRDQGHAMMSTMVAANLAQIAYTLYTQNTSVKALDFFSAEDNALLKLGEYVALSNLRDGTDNSNELGIWLIEAEKMPFNTYVYCIGCSCKDKNHGATHTQMANDSGRGDVRPGWEIFYCHYAKIKGLSSGFTYVKQFADKLRPECGSGDSRYGSNSGAFDQLGWGTLMLYR